jgi:hypothetical protein
VPSSHRSIQDSTTTLPASNGDRDFEQAFDAPGLSSTTSTHARPYLSYRVNPGDDSGVRVVMELNGTEIVNQTIDTTVSRTFNEIFDHGILQASGNELRVFVPNDEPGTVQVQDLVMVYTSA